MIPISKELLEDAGIVPYYTTGRYKAPGIKAYFQRLFKIGGWRYYETFHRAWKKYKKYEFILNSQPPIVKWTGQVWDTLNWDPIELPYPDWPYS